MSTYIQNFSLETQTPLTDSKIYSITQNRNDIILDNYLNEFEAGALLGATLPIKTGGLMAQGRWVESDSEVDVVIPLPTVNEVGHVVVRIDLTPPTTAVDSVEIIARSGEEFIQENLLEGEYIYEIPLYRYNASPTGVTGITDVRRIRGRALLVWTGDSGINETITLTRKYKNFNFIVADYSTEAVQEMEPIQKLNEFGYVNFAAINQTAGNNQSHSHTVILRLDEIGTNGDQLIIRNCSSLQHKVSIDHGSSLNHSLKRIWLI